VKTKKISGTIIYNAVMRLGLIEMLQ